jgi:hypothetical protein
MKILTIKKKCYNCGKTITIKGKAIPVNELIAPLCKLCEDVLYEREIAILQKYGKLSATK